jgi:hypothetical protein
MVRVKARWVIELPQHSKVKVKKGEVVDRGDVVAVGETNQKTKADWSGWFGQLDDVQKETLRGVLAGRDIKIGEKIDLGEAKIFGVKNLSAEIEGKIETIDEFGNLIVVQTSGEKQSEITCPVKAKVDVVTSEKIELVFTANKIEGQGLTSGRVWGVMDKECWLRKITDLGSRLTGKVLAVETLDDLWLIKAAVVGVAAVVTKEWVMEDEESVELGIPVLKLGKKEWAWLKDEIDNKEQTILVNSELNRALVVKS